MNHAVVKVKMRGTGNKYRKLISDKALYQMPDYLENSIPYSPTHNLDEDSWFVISEFSKQTYYLPILKNDFISTEFDIFRKVDFDKLDYLFSYQDNNQFFFQKITATQLLVKKSISIGDAVEYRENTAEIIIKSCPDALYLRNEDKLYFKKLSAIKNIFRGIDILYREATKNEVGQFLNNSFIELDNDFSTEHVKLANRKRIAMAIDTINGFGKTKKKIVFQSIREYCPELITDSNKFKITSEADLKLLLYGIDQRFYTTPDGEEKRIANSIIKLS